MSKRHRGNKVCKVLITVVESVIAPLSVCLHPQTTACAAFAVNLP